MFLTTFIYLHSANGVCVCFFIVLTPSHQLFSACLTGTCPCLGWPCKEKSTQCNPRVPCCVREAPPPDLCSLCAPVLQESQPKDPKEGYSPEAGDPQFAFGVGGFLGFMTLSEKLFAVMPCPMLVQTMQKPCMLLSTQNEASAMKILNILYLHFHI